MKNWRSSILLCVLVLCQTAPLWVKTVDVVREFGADNTGVKNATDNIQKAIDACQTGDTLLIPPGTYLLDSGLDLKSDTTVQLSKGAIVQANTANVWLKNHTALFGAKDLKNVTITGGGIIDGGRLVYPRGKYSLPRPGHGIAFTNCSNMAIRDVTVRNIPPFAIDYINSSNITADSVTIRGRGFFNLKGSADGMNVEGCKNVKISNCDIEVGDDTLCIKTNEVSHPCHDND